MKHSASFVRKFILPGLLLLAVPLAAHAEAQFDEAGGHEGHPPFPHEMHAGHHGSHCEEAFPFPPGVDLSESQRDKIFSINHTQAQLLYDQDKIVRNAHIDLHKLATSDQYDDNKAKEITEKLGKALGTIALLHAQELHQIFAILTPEQRKILNSLPFAHPEGHPRFPFGAEGDKSGPPAHP